MVRLKKESLALRSGGLSKAWEKQAVNIVKRW